jgi:hypothetical protein
MDFSGSLGFLKRLMISLLTSSSSK